MCLFTIVLTVLVPIQLAPACSTALLGQLWAGVDQAWRGFDELIVCVFEQSLVGFDQIWARCRPNHYRVVDRACLTKVGALSRSDAGRSLPSLELSTKFGPV